MTLVISDCFDGEGKINGHVIYYNIPNNYIYSHASQQRIDPTHIWEQQLQQEADRLRKRHYLELSNPVLLNYVCYLIETNQIVI
jgi:hypothetical protein